MAQRSGLNAVEIRRMFKDYDQLTRTMDGPEAEAQLASKYLVDTKVITSWLGSRAAVEKRDSEPFSSSLPPEEAPKRKRKARQATPVEDDAVNDEAPDESEPEDATEAA